MITIRDALAEKKVVVTAVIQPGLADTPRDKREIVLTVGIPDERVVIKTGQFSQLHQLITAAWSEYGEIVMAETAVIAEPEEIGSAAPDDEETAVSIYNDDDF